MMLRCFRNLLQKFAGSSRPEKRKPRGGRGTPYRAGSSRLNLGSYRPLLEVLETRCVPTVITVTGTGDTIAVDGVVTLREALTAANTDAAAGDAPAGQAGPGTVDLIKFNIAGAGVHTITP